MNKQSHFEPKATLRASSAIDARPPFQVLEGVLPVVGSTPSIPSFLMSSHFLSIWTGFYGVIRGPSCTGLTTSKVVKGRFEEVSAAQRSVQMAPNFADM